MSTGYRRPGTCKGEVSLFFADQWTREKLTPKDWCVVKVLAKLCCVQGRAGDEKAEVGTEASDIL